MGNPFVHLDLASADVAASKKFYGSVFDWKFKDFPEMGNWTGIDVGKGVGGGIGPKQMPEQPSAWTAYVEVHDIANTVAKAVKAGATVIVPPMPVGAMGSLAVFIDPQGATIGVWQQAKAPTKKAPAKKAAPKAKAKPKKPVAKKKPAAKKKR